MIELIYYIIISAMALLLLYNLVRKRPVNELVCVALVLVTFALRSLHIK